ncbi:MAG: dTMP kinase [Treponema sp.]|nr:dTMP kinase [Treponema sp.]MBD5412919.1 dTMP kinase [Treponema sp.]MBD5443005.1 dTMP kinase [Treponema sp.]
MIIKNYIVFEGIDGSGTTTQVKALANHFAPEKTFVTAEPTNMETGKFLRRMLKGEFAVDEKTASYLFAADRCEHIYGKNGIMEHAHAGKIIISDRYFFSSLAYQSVSCGKELPELLNSPFPLPEWLFYMKIAPEAALERVAHRGNNPEIYERLDFQKKSAALYDKIIAEYNGTKKGEGMKVITVNASASIDETSNFIWDCLKKMPIR